MKRLFILVLAFVMIAASVVVPMNVKADKAKAAGSYSPSEPYESSIYCALIAALPLTGDQRLDILNAALTQVGYHEGDCFEDLNGCNIYGTHDHTEYGYQFGVYFMGTVPYFTPWCAFFVSWCARRALISEAVLNTAAYANPEPGPYNFHVQFRPAGSYFPVSGDLIFYDFTGSGTKWNHTGLVLFVEGGFVYTVEGNMGHCVSIRRHRVEDITIRGYGVPEYENSDLYSFELSSYPEPEHTLRPGAEGDEVRWLQCALNHLRIATPITGVFDANTKKSVRRFQELHGIDTTGNYGPLTRAAMSTALEENGSVPADPGIYPIPERTLSEGMTGDDVRWLQAALSRVGMEITVTGVFNHSTSRQLAYIQRCYGLNGSGVCDEVTRDLLIGLVEPLMPHEPEPAPTAAPTAEPTTAPSETPEPELPEPSSAPTAASTAAPSAAPTTAPTPAVTAAATAAPTAAPTTAPAPSPTAAPTPAPGTDPDEDYPFEGFPFPQRILKFGDYGEDVKWVAAVLRRIGFDLVGTGYFGVKTEAAVKVFQYEFGLPVDGIVDFRTRNYMRNYMKYLDAVENGATPADPTDPVNFPYPTTDLYVGCTGDSVKWVQACLRKMGMDVPLDGYYSELIAYKISWFQSEMGLEPTGVTDRWTATYLRNVIAWYYSD